jgi:hypothetical protein
MYTFIDWLVDCVHRLRRMTTDLELYWLHTEKTCWFAHAQFWYKCLLIGWLCTQAAVNDNRSGAQLFAPTKPAGLRMCNSIAHTVIDWLIVYTGWGKWWQIWSLIGRTWQNLLVCVCAILVNTFIDLLTDCVHRLRRMTTDLELYWAHQQNLLVCACAILVYMLIDWFIDCVHKLRRMTTDLELHWSHLAKPAWFAHVQFW